jgi:hypothetical protein
MAYGNVTVQNRDMGADIWSQMLKQAQGLQSGNINPWELPEYKQYQQQYQDWMDKFMKNLYSQASAKGMNPGAVMQQLKDQIPQQLGKAMQDFTTQAYGRVLPTAQGGIKNFNDMLNQWMQKQQLDFQKNQASQQNTMGWAKTGIGALTGLVGALIPGGPGGTGMGGTPDYAQAYGMNNSQAPNTWGYT